MDGVRDSPMLHCVAMQMNVENAVMEEDNDENVLVFLETERFLE